MNPLVLIIDPDTHSATELTDLIMDRREKPEVMTATSVLVAERALSEEAVDWLFIRIRLRDDYQHLVPELSLPPARVVFLSPGRANCTEHLADIVDAHLKPPCSLIRLGRIWGRLSHPRFTPRPLDFFSLKTIAGTRSSGMVTSARCGAAATKFRSLPTTAISR